MKPFKGYEEAKVLTGSQRLPVDGYVVGILEASEINLSWGDVLEIQFDIAEGDYKNFYTEQYKNSQMEDKKYKGNFRINIPKDDGSDLDNFTGRKFKTNMKAIEDSNPGYHWDWKEAGLKGKKVGLVFRDKEYDFQGRQGFWTEPFKFVPVEEIRSGKFKIPSPKFLDKDKSDGYVSIGESIDDDDLPF